MIFLLAKQRFLSNIFTMRFTISFILCVILFAASTLILSHDYTDRLEEYRAAVQENENALKEINIFSQLHVGLVRPTSPLSIISEGAEKRLGNSLVVGFDQAPTIAEERGTRNPLLAVFPSFDVVMIIEVILSLFVIFLAYNTISGEREQGTLKLMLSNNIPRHTVLLGNFIGGMASIIFPLLIGLLISVLFIQTNSLIEFTSGDYLSLFLIFILAVIFLSAFFLLGMFLSSRIKRSATVLIILLVVWVVTVVILPHTAVYLARQLMTVPDKATVDRQAQTLLDEWVDDMNRYAEKHPWPGMSIRTELQKEFSESDIQFIQKVERHRRVYTGSWPFAYRYDYGPREMVEWYYDGSIYGHNLRMDYEDRIWKLYQDYQQKLDRQAQFARTLSLVSPSWAFYHASSCLAGTGETGYLRFLEQAAQYRNELITYMKNNSGFDYLLFTKKPVDEFLTARELILLRKSQGEEAVMKIVNYQTDPLDLSDLPRFSFSGSGPEKTLAFALPEILVLIFLNIIFFSMAWVSFLRADVR